MRLVATVAGFALTITGLNASAETIRIAIGTQDTTINCATGGLLIRELPRLTPLGLPDADHPPLRIAL